MTCTVCVCVCVWYSVHAGEGGERRQVIRFCNLAPLIRTCCLVLDVHTQIFVKFTETGGAQVCKDKIHGRLYGGQLVQVRAGFNCAQGCGCAWWLLPPKRSLWPPLCLDRHLRPRTKGAARALLILGAPPAPSITCAQVYFISEEAFLKV